MFAYNIALYFALLSCVGSALGFELLHDYSGQNFFDGWDFYGYWDNLTLGNVTWVSEPVATQQQLAYINDAGNAIMRVDNFTNVTAGEMRNSVRITSQEFYDFGSVWIIDAIHLPYGCSVWPAFWSKGAHWPDDGEIDIVEAINVMPNNQMALHTTDGCKHVTPPGQTGNSIDLDCGTGSGCTVGETAPNSYESGFAAAGGGVFATQFDVTGIYMWFWSRPNIPESIKNATATSSINISSWGPPSASFPNNTACNISNFFTPQQLIFDITLCGDWAGVPGIYDSTCYNAGPTHTCYADNVVGNGSNYDEAYFEVSYVRTYTTGTVAPSSTSSGLPPPTALQPEPTLAQKSGAACTGGVLRNPVALIAGAALAVLSLLCI